MNKRLVVLGLMVGVLTAPAFASPAAEVSIDAITPHLERTAERYAIDLGSIAAGWTAPEALEPMASSTAGMTVASLLLSHATTAPGADAAADASHRDAGARKRADRPPRGSG